MIQWVVFCKYEYPDKIYSPLTLHICSILTNVILYLINCDCTQEIFTFTWDTLLFFIKAVLMDHSTASSYNTTDAIVSNNNTRGAYKYLMFGNTPACVHSLPPFLTSLFSLSYMYGIALHLKGWWGRLVVKAFDLHAEDHVRILCYK